MKLLRAVAVSQILGGIAVVVLTLWMRTLHGAPLLFIALSEGLGVLAIVAGIWLWRGDRRGVRLSRALQAMQVLSLWTPSVTYVVVLGGQGLLAVVGDKLRWHMGLYGQVVVGPGAGGPYGLGVNLLAVLALVALYRAPQRLPQIDAAPGPVAAV